MTRDRRMLRGAAILASLLFVTGCGRGDAIAQERQTDQEVRERALGSDVPAVVDTSTAASLSQTFRAAAAIALPSVVTVDVTAQPQAGRQQRQSPFPFFDRMPQQPMPRQGTGSGFVFTDEGHIITNNHVVEGATDITIQFPDGRVYDDVEVVGRDPNSDIAVVRIRNGDDPFTPLELGDSDRLQVGDWVIALGNPLDLGFTVTAGIVSAKGRSIGILRREAGAMALESFIQTDAAINRGNSGGPLVDLYGRAVGVNTAISSPTGAYAGNGFAVPIALAAEVARDLIEFGYARRPQLGVSIQPVSEAQAEAYGLDRIAGAFVAEVTPGSAADEAGIRPEDIIVSLNGVRVADSSELISRLAREEPGDEVTLGIVREGRRIEVEAELGEFEVDRPETELAEAPASAETLLGINVGEVTRNVLEQLDIREAVDGVVVMAVDPRGPAAGRFNRGDILLEINGQRVESVRGLQRLVQDVDRGDVVRIRYRNVATGNQAVQTFRLR